MTEDQQVPFADANIEGYRCLLYVEIALREVAKHALCTEYGEAWQRRIPGHYLNKIRADQNDEANRANLGFRRLGPLYYLTFGELVELSLQRPVVELVRRVLGQHGPELLKDIVPSRNAIAHCRNLPENALASVRTLNMHMATGLTQHALAHLTQQPDIGLYPDEARKRLVNWLVRVRTVVTTRRALSSDSADYHRAAHQYWWSSSDLAGFDVRRVDRLATAILDYSALPSGVGAVLARERCISASSLLSELDDVILMLGGTT